MPELPEVEVVRVGLDPAVRGATIAGLEVHDDRALTRHRGDADDFRRRLIGQRLLGTARRGKFLWFTLSDESSALLAHLGMSGQLLLRESGASRERHERIRMNLVHPTHGDLAVIFADQRTFGSLAIDALDRAGADATPTQVTHIGRDPLDPQFHPETVLDRWQSRRSAVKRALLDQTVVSGVGNIYADEALWGARIHPESAVNSLSRDEGTTLLTQVRAVFERALAEGGTSFDAQYVDVNGQAGYFAHSLNAYGRDGEPCLRCGTPIGRLVIGGRSSHFCPRCQRRG